MQDFEVRFNFVFSEIDMRRICVKYSSNSNHVDLPEIQVDLHGLTCSEANRFVRNIIALFPNDSFSLILIHGYHHGQAIKTMLSSSFTHSRISTSISNQNNPGRTTYTII